MKVVVSAPARAALMSHWRFMLEAYDEAYAQRTLDLINAGIRFIADSPGAGQYETALDHMGQGHRRWVVGHYKLIYLVLEDQLVITDFFDTRQDPKKMKG
jgi:toxin ParE1/3/4